MNHKFSIDGKEIAPGSNAQVNLYVSRLPSGNRINIQANVFRSLNDGPTVLILGGVHGDEINGIQIVQRMLFNQAFNELKAGSVIAIPLLNVFGFIHFSRDVPDGKDVNRSFPGSSTGSLASRTASVLTKKILPVVDIAIDLHTGGASRYNYPQIRYSKKDERAFDLGQTFGAPYLIQKPWISKSFRKTANLLGISVLVYEAGESTRLDGFSIDMGVAGIKRTLHSLGMLDNAPPANHTTHSCNTTGWVRASEAGLFMWNKESGSYVRKGELLGIIQSPQGDRTKRIIAKKDGHIIGHNNASVVHNGDALFHVAYD